MLELMFHQRLTVEPQLAEQLAKSPELRRLLKAFQRDAWAKIGRMDTGFDMGWMTCFGFQLKCYFGKYTIDQACAVLFFCVPVESSQAIVLAISS